LKNTKTKRRKKKKNRKKKEKKEKEAYVINRQILGIVTDIYST
jgi:hypothetical protein